MDDRTAEAALATTKFGIGQSVPRSEDPTLVRGEGRYTDDINRPGQLYAVMVRSTHAHGVIRAIDTAAAKAMPGVLGVYTGADLTAYGTLHGAHMSGLRAARAARDLLSGART